MSQKICIHWFRQDLRLAHNPALFKALEENEKTLLLYIYDEDSLPIGGASKWWLEKSLNSLTKDIAAKYGHLCLRKGNPKEILLSIAKELNIGSVYWNRCYEPSIIERDKEIKSILTNHDIHCESFNGSLLFEPWEIKNKQGNTFRVFTPFWKTCLSQLNTPNCLPAPLTLESTIQHPSENLESWKLYIPHPHWAKNFENQWEPGENGAQKNLEKFIDDVGSDYSKKRNLPYIEGTSKLSPHLHFGEISPHQIIDRLDIASHATFVSEIGWREFSYYLLFNFPHIVDTPIQEKFSKFPWQKNDIFLKAWQKGKTGFPIVDAGMRQLWQTGWMHNRVRMIVASFLIKDLFIDWREGADWFWDTLVDADLASNSASWQWVAGSGMDAAPYFRIFNPISQGEKFDPEGEYVRKWVPELAKLPKKYIHKPWETPKEVLESAEIAFNDTYPRPIVDHAEMRQKALAIFKSL